MNKKWLILGTVSFSIGLSLSLVINKDIKQAALTGLLSIPATTAGVLITEYQRRQKFNEKISRQQGQLQGLIQKESDFNNSIALLSEQVESLKQQEESITAVIESLNVDHQRYLQLATRSQSELEAIQNKVYELSNRKLSLEPEIITLEIQLLQLQEQEIGLAKLLADLSNSQKQIETSIESSRYSRQQLQEQKFDLEENINNLAKQKQTLAEQLNSQQHSLNQLQQQTANFNQSIVSLNQEKQEIESQIEALQTTLSDLQISDLQNLVLKQQELSEQDKFQLKAAIEQLQQQKIELDLALTNLRLEKQEIESNCTVSKTQLSQLQNLVLEQQQLQKQLEEELVNLEKQQKLVTQLQLLQPPIGIEDNGVKQPSEGVNDSVINSSEAIIKKTEEASNLQEIISVYINNNDDFRNPKYTKYLWENTILPYWSHKNLPTGCRFLGNVDIEYTESDRLISIVGKNLQKLDCITDNSLQKSFSALDKDWIKIITFALSEYAYYYSDEKFWSGFCDRIGIEHNQTVENTLRQITEQGIELLGLIRAKDGYKYVSTLWLQSGVPKQNLGHFATLVQDIADEYGWWEISHSSALDIAEALLQCWENRYSQWGTIKHFLKLENSNEDLEPISGQLVKNIAIVARELEHQNIASEQLRDRETREEILNDSNLSYSFFLRDWSDLITVLTPRYESRGLSLIKRRNNQLPYLYLDIANTLNTLLILPEQSLWKKEWQNLRNTYCLIPEAEWEDNLPSQGNLEIPKLEIDIKQATDKWTCQLQNHHRNQIYRWEHEGINLEFPCLIFDAISGDHIRINISAAKIIGIAEIVLFTPKEIEIELDNNIEVIDNFVPSSIKGWRGKEFRLIESKTLIQLQGITIDWQLKEEEQPQLIGKRIKGTNLIYINPPTFYYPPIKKEVTLNYSIENIDKKTIIAKDHWVLFVNSRWTDINLWAWITEAGNFQAKFWQQEKQWSYSFEVRQEFKIDQYQEYRNTEIRDRHNNVLSIPTKYDNKDGFWAEEIKINNLYPLEELTSILKSDHEQYIFHLQADSSGELTLSLASLYGYLPKCERYSLGFKQLGLEFYTILQVGNFLSWTIRETEVVIEKLPLQDNYYLSGWNLLNPNKESEIINFSSAYSEPTIVNLSFSPGIYHIQLYQEQQLIENIGLWCGINLKNIPKEINDNEDLANYCYTILGNESLEDFSNALKQIKSNFDQEKIETLIIHLHQEKYYLPEWLNKDSLNQKLQKILETLLMSRSFNNKEQKLNMVTIKTTNQVSTISGQWCLVTVRQWKRESFLKYLNNDLEKKQLQNLILEIVALEESVYDNMVLLRISNYSEAISHLQQIDHFQGIQRLKPNEANRMINK